MPKKQSEYIVRFQLREGVDEAICRHAKFAKKKLEQLGTIHPTKSIKVIISGTKVEKVKHFSYLGADWEQHIKKV